MILARRLWNAPTSAEHRYVTPPLPVDRLLVLDGVRVWVSIIRARDQRGRGVVRNGTLRLVAPADEVRRILEERRDDPIAQILDDDELPIVSLLGTDLLSMHNKLLSVEFRASFRVDIIDRPFKPAFDDFVPMNYDRASRQLAAELEAGFRSLLLFRPDPEPGAGAPLRHGIPPPAPGPLKDNSVRFAVGHVAATLHPVDDGIKITCILSEVRFQNQKVHTFRPASGEWYPLEDDAIERLGSDIRAFLCERGERFVITNAPVDAATLPPAVEDE
jgi:hypothetical protein